MVTNVRHIQILEESAAHMEGFLTGLSLGMSVDFLVIDLQNAWEKLGKITGETVEEDLLDQIFSKFCLGK
jgi:tRNA modification GTPase